MAVIHEVGRRPSHVQPTLPSHAQLRSTWQQWRGPVGATAGWVIQFVLLLMPSAPSRDINEFMPFISDSVAELVAHTGMCAFLGAVWAVIWPIRTGLGDVRYWASGFVIANALVLAYMLHQGLDYMLLGGFTIYGGLNCVFVLLPVLAGASLTTFLRSSLPAARSLFGTGDSSDLPPERPETNSASGRDATSDHHGSSSDLVGSSPGGT